MAAQRDSAVWGEHTGSRDISHLRRVPFDSDVPVREATWHNLVKDIQQLLRLARPAAIVAPHPQVDPHGDHRFTTIAALEALEKSGWSGKLLLYANHVVGSELYPYGPRDGVITVPPLRKDIVFSGMLSIELDRVQVLRKQLAIEAQHDLQPAPSDAMPTMGRAMRSALRDVYCGMVVPDNDYVRRAARRNELYFVVDSSEAAELKRRSLQDS
jgi:LmbE family N-acetylglucosaminyl deacetylase